MNDFVDNIFKALHSGNFTTVFSALILLFITVPVVLLVAIRRSRLWIKEGIEGDNKRLDWDEIVKLYALFANFICLLLYTFMIITHGINAITWGLEDKMITAAIAVGADAALITAVVVKYKANKPKE